MTEPTTDESDLKTYTGVSHTLLTHLPPFLCWLAGVAFTVFGPHSWWVDYLLFGAVWGIIKPLRILIRAILKYSTHEFRDAETFSWFDCVKGEWLDMMSDVRHKPKIFFEGWLAVMGLSILFWPVTIYLGTTIGGALDVG